MQQLPVMFDTAPLVGSKKSLLFGMNRGLKHLEKAIRIDEIVVNITILHINVTRPNEQ